MELYEANETMKPVGETQEMAAAANSHLRPLSEVSTEEILKIQQEIKDLYKKIESVNYTDKYPDAYDIKISEILAIHYKNCLFEFNRDYIYDTIAEAYKYGFLKGTRYEKNRQRRKKATKGGNL